jgi:hypothetical protein
MIHVIMGVLDIKIAECDAKLAKLEAQIADLKSYRRGLEHARALTGAPGASDSEGGGDVTARRAPGRGLSPTWTRMLQFIGTEVKTLDQIMNFSDTHGLGVLRNTARSQIHTMVKETGLLERLGRGEVRLTQKGMEAIGLQKSEDPSAGTGGSSSTTSVLADTHPER